VAEDAVNRLTPYREVPPAAPTPPKVFAGYTKCGSGWLEPMHRCRPPGAFARWWYGIRDGQKWACGVCELLYQRRSRPYNDWVRF